MSVPPNTALAPVNPPRPLSWPSSIVALQAACDPKDELYLVGGAVRDAFLRRPLHDIDLATPGDGCLIARRIANRLKGDYFPLDHQRGVGRAILEYDGTRLVVDVARFRGPNLLTDLQNRDFTVNAMAVLLCSNLQAVIDPMGGLPDLENHLLRRCSPDAIRSDPVRALRAIRASISLNLRVDQPTRDDLRLYAHLLSQVSHERIRDEFFQILDGPGPHTALDVLQRLNLLDPFLPELHSLINLAQSPPHTLDVWRHTLSTVERLHQLIAIITGPHDDNLTANFQLGTIVFVLGSVREALQQHLAQIWPNDRSHRALLLFAALMHDIGKPATHRIDDTGHVRFFQHEQVGAEMAFERSTALRLSNDEAGRVRSIVQHHMRPLHLSTGQAPTPRALYRFWQSTGDIGIDVCLLSLADFLATYGVTLDNRMWLHHLDVIRSLLESYFERYSPNVSGESLINGQDLIDHFGLSPGPRIGRLLDQIREAQALGEITTKKEALNWAQHLLKDENGDL